MTLILAMVVKVAVRPPRQAADRPNHTLSRIVHTKFLCGCQPRIAAFPAALFHFPGARLYRCVSMIQLLLLTAIITAFVLWLSTEARTVLRRRLPRLLGYVGLSLLALLVATGRLHWILGLLLGAALLGRRLLAKLNGPTKGARPQTEGCGYLQTKNLVLTIDPRNGRIDGTILESRQQGRRLSELALNELQVLHNAYLALDEETAALLAAYLDQTHTGWQANGADWGTENTSYDPGGGTLSDSQAHAMLGLANGADRAQIVAAHRRLIQRLHPDRGGSNYLAARLNAAKAQLLRTRRPNT